MRFRVRPLTILAVSIPTALMGVLAACGGGDNTTTDAGNDATVVDAAKDVKPDVPTVVDAGCDAPDLLSALPAADASIDVDAGGFNIGPCLGCMEDTSSAGCGSALTTCNGDCYCRQGVIDAVLCVQQSGNAQSCFLQALSSNNANLAALVGCAYHKCQA